MTSILTVVSTSGRNLRLKSITLRILFSSKKKSSLFFPLSIRPSPTYHPGCALLLPKYRVQLSKYLLNLFNGWPINGWPLVYS